VRKRSAQWQRQADRNPNLVRIGVQPRFGNRALPARRARDALPQDRGAARRRGRARARRALERPR
jgi:hypothetical protein